MSLSFRQTSGRKVRRAVLYVEPLEPRQVPSFLAPRSFAAGHDPRSVVTGDFNGDGLADLAVADHGDFSGNGSGVGVLLGNGDGTFATPSVVAAGTHPTAVVAADWNGDGLPDLALVSLGGYAWALSSDGNGTFQTTATFSGGYNSASLAVGDWNGDGLPDLAVGNEADTAYPGDVGVLLGAGDGSFQTAPTFATGGPEPEAVAVGDFNGDGKPDLAVTNRGTAPFFRDSSLSMLLGNGDGSFQPARIVAAGIPFTALAVADFNGDGLPDLAVTDASHDTVDVLLGMGDGSFQAPSTFAVGSAPDSVAVADFNGDGLPDFAVADSSSNDVSVLLGNGDGSFQPARVVVAGTSPESVVVGDFNGDGIPDLAVANYAADGTASVLLGNGDGSFQPFRSFAAGLRPFAVAAGDLNGDGLPDLAVTSRDGATVQVLLSQGDGSFRAAPLIAPSPDPIGVVIGDFNADGLADLAVAGARGVQVLLGNGDGSFLIPPSNYLAGTFPVALEEADLNGDGQPDLVTTNAGSNDVAILLNDGTGAPRPGELAHHEPTTHPAHRSPPPARLAPAAAVLRPLDGLTALPAQGPADTTIVLRPEPTPGALASALTDDAPPRPAVPLSSDTLARPTPRRSAAELALLRDDQPLSTEASASGLLPLS